MEGHVYEAPKDSNLFLEIDCYYFRSVEVVNVVVVRNEMGL